MIRVTVVLLLLIVASIHNVVSASESSVPLSDIDVETSPQAYQRGAKVVIDVCMLCHNLKYIKYRNLADIGFNEQQVDALRGDKKLDDIFKATMSDEVADKVFGMIPPDLSVMAKARKGGANYIYTLLTSYHEQADGKIDNRLFPGIKMPDTLDLSVEIDDKRKQLQEQKARDVSSFLLWASDPHADTRHTMGAFVIGYFILLTIMLWLWKRRVWADLK